MPRTKTNDLQGLIKRFYDSGDPFGGIRTLHSYKDTTTMYHAMFKACRVSGLPVKCVKKKDRLLLKRDDICEV